MLPYFMLAGSTAVSAWFNSAAIATINNVKRERGITARQTRWFVVDFLIIAALVSFSALRFEVGTDFGNYVRSYGRLTAGNWAEQIAASSHEFGYVALELSLKHISEGPELLLWVTSAITVIPAYLAVKKNSINPGMSIILFLFLGFYLTPLNVVRQGMAVSLNFWAYTFIDKNKKAFVLINIIAASLHVTALYAAVIQLVLHKKKLSPRAFIGISSVTVLAFVFPSLWTWVIDLSDRTSGRYEDYLEVNAAGIGTYVLIGVRLALTAYALLLGKSKNSGTYALYSMVGIAFLVLGTQSFVISRMSDYFAIFLILLVPNQTSNSSRRYVHAAIIYSAGLVYFWQHLSNWGGLIPYQMAP